MKSFINELETDEIELLELAQLSIDAAEHLMIDDLKEKQRYVIKAIGGEKEKVNYSKNELDALTCTLYNGNAYDFSKWK